MRANIIHKILPTVLMIYVAALTASENITNYSSSVAINDFFQWSDTLWAATGGGLRIHNLKNDSTEFISNSRIFPDLHLTAVCRDNSGNLWIGSRKGYLYKRNQRGQFTVFSNYKISEWGILSLFSYDGFIVVGSNKGVSLFDPVKGVAFRNAANIANFSNPRVNTITASITGDTLFLGCDEGIAYLDSLYTVPLSQRNFYYSGIWKTKRTGITASIVQTEDSIITSSKPSVMFRGFVLTASDSGWVLNGGRRLVKVPISSSILALHNESDKRLWIGTDEAFYFSFDGDTLPVQRRIDGMTLKRATRIFTDGNGDVWFLPEVPYPKVTWHHGVYRFDGRDWHLYNDYTYPEKFGYIGDGSAGGIAPGLNGTMWFGMSGGNVKHIDSKKNTVEQLIIGYRDFRNFNYVVNGVGDIVWGKADALATDTSGYLWLSVYESDLGSLICYDQRYYPVSSMESNPSKAHYRRFFTEPPYKTTSITMLHVDADNRIFAYDVSRNLLTVFRHGGNPLVDGIVIDTVYNQFTSITAFVTAADGATYITDVSGLKKITTGSLDLKSVDNTITGATSLAIWGDVLWLGTRTNGVLRYDISTGERKWIDESLGLPSNNVAAVSIDKKNGRLWIATDEGVSQLDISRNVKVSSKGAIRVFPNILSVSGSNQGLPKVTFAEIEPQSSISIYTVNGSLVAKISAEHFVGDEWRAAWTPKRSLSPGTYIAVAKPSGKKAKIILKP